MMGYYLMMRPGDAKDWEIVSSAKDPTNASHGSKYSGAIGPFKTKNAARFMRNTYPNPHCQTVQAAERLARKYPEMCKESVMQEKSSCGSKKSYLKMKKKEDDTSEAKKCSKCGKTGCKCTVAEISNGAKIAGMKRVGIDMTGGNPDMQKIANSMSEAIDKADALLAEMDAVLDQTEEMDDAENSADVRKMDKVRRKRIKRGRGRATSKQRSSAKKNVKKAQMSLRTGTGKAQARKTRKRRDRMRGKH